MGSRVPLIGRLHLHEYFALGASFAILALELVVRTITLLLPSPIISFLYRLSRNAFNGLSSPYSRRARNRKKVISSTIAQAQDFTELCEIYGYHVEEHIVQTGDGYLLGLHRIPFKRGEEDQRVNAGPGSVQKKVVYLHHGLLMNSEVWMCITDRERCLPLVLVEQGYDVWLGNNRGNKYSKKCLHYAPTEIPFWNFSMDQFAFHDIPDSINYILSTTHQPSLSYIGFSQGTAQAFASLSTHPTLNSKLDVFVALAPAMAPPGLASGIVRSLTKSNPEVLFLAFGRRAIMSSATMWSAILYPAIFTWCVDKGLVFLFNWKTANIAPHQKLAAYPHLYSFTSVKSVVHWFQIIRNGTFQMYDDEVSSPTSFSTASKYYKVAKFPTRNIKTPIVLLWGGNDSLVDINVMLRELPKHTEAKCIAKYEHLDFLWAHDVDKLVFPYVFDALESYAAPGDTKGQILNWRRNVAPVSRNPILALQGSGSHSGVQPPGYSDDERARTAGNRALTLPDRVHLSIEQPTDETDVDTSAATDDDDESGPDQFSLAPSAFAHSSRTLLTVRRAVGDSSVSPPVASPGSVASSQATMTMNQRRTRFGTPESPQARRPPPTDITQSSPPVQSAGVQSPPGSPLKAPTTTTERTAVRSRPEGWWSSTNTSRASLNDPVTTHHDPI